MLHYNAPRVEDDSYHRGAATINAPLEASAWKVLILDAVGQRILSPIMKVNDLRDHGVTLYLQLHSDRQSIPDVPAIYFVEPSAENIARIGQDLQAHMYESFYLNFTSSLPRTLMEDLAHNSVQSGTSALIAKVFDQYLNFVTLEANLFSLGLPDTYVALNDARSSEALIESTLDHVSSSLFSVLLTLEGQPPLIYASKGTSAELLGEKLETRIRNYLLNAKTSYLGTHSELAIEDSLQRPLMLLLDRNIDVSTLLRHTSTYNALVHDILGMKLNRVSVVKSEGGQSETRVYDIDVKDAFWQQNAPLPFPTVAESVDAALNKYKADMQQVTRQGGGIAQLQTVDDLSNASSSLTADELKVAISVLPELTERKRIIDSHLQMSTSLLEQIKARDLGNIFHLEQDAAEQPRSKIIEALRAKEGTPVDKMRLFLVFYFAQEQVSKEDMAVYEVCLREAGCDMAALEYCKKIKALQKMSQRTVQTSQSAAARGDFLQTFGSKISGGVLGNMLSSVKNLLPESADTPLTKLVEAAIENATGAATGAASAIRSTLAGGSTPKEELFTSFDPKLRGDKASGRGGGLSPTAASSGPQRSAFNHLIVFIVGGSNYTEYNHVEEWMRKRQLRMGVTFGSTELLTGEEFLNQLSRLYHS